MSTQKRDVFLTLSEEDLLDQVMENSADTSAHVQAAFLMNYRLAKTQARFNMIVTVATVVMAVQAVASVVALFK